MEEEPEWSKLRYQGMKELLGMKHQSFEEKIKTKVKNVSAGCNGSLT